MNWFEELGKGRRDLPYELTKVFSDQEKQELKNSANQSFDHIERVFGFRKLLEYREESADELWSDLQAIIDDSSYYACLALPLVRQLLEPSVNFVYLRLNPSEQKTSTDASEIPIPLCIDSLPSEKKIIVIDAWMAAHLLARDADAYMHLESSSDLIVWLKRFLGSCSQLLLIASRMAQLPDTDRC